VEVGITERCPQDVPTDPSKSIDADPNSHDKWSFKKKLVG
jgi:hypothetical protein